MHTCILALYIHDYIVLTLVLCIHVDSVDHRHTLWYICISTHLHLYISTPPHLYIFTYLNIYTSTHLHIYISTSSTYLHTYLSKGHILHIYIPTHIHTYIPTYLHIDISTCLHIYTSTYSHVYISTYPHIHIYMSGHISAYLGDNYCGAQCGAETCSGWLYISCTQKSSTRLEIPACDDAPSNKFNRHARIKGKGCRNHATPGPHPIRVLCTQAWFTETSRV